MSRWRWGISVAGVVTALLVIWGVAQNEEEPVHGRPEVLPRRAVEQPTPESGIRNGAEQVEKLRLEYLAREKTKLEQTNPFAASSWYRPPRLPVPPPMLPPEPVAPPPEPAAPPLPFSYLGRYEDGAKRLVLLLRGDQMYTVAEGDSIDNNYRVKKIDGGAIEMIYLPLGIIQTIDTGEYAFSARNQKRGQ